VNLKKLMFMKAASGGNAPTPIAFAYKLSSYTSGTGSGDSRRDQIENGNGPYAAGYGTSQTDLPIRNATGDGETYYPILLNGASKIYFDVPDNIKVTVFFVNTQEEDTTYNCAKWVGGDKNAYDSTVTNGPREVAVPEGADAFTFTLYYRSNTVTDEIASAVTITAT